MSPSFIRISRILALLTCSATLMSAFAASAPPSGFIFPNFIFTDAPFPSAHASTLVELRNGDILAAWFGGAHEGASDVAIWSSRYSVGHWSAPAVLVREPNVPCWNPVLFHSADGTLWVYYKFGPEIRGWTGARLRSSDEGLTWSAPEHLPAGLLGPIKDKPIVSGSSVESYSSWAVWVDRSTDNGATWQKSGPITVPSAKPLPAQQAGKPEQISGIIQPAIVSLGSLGAKHLRLYARATTDIGHICAADSFDNGITWTPAHPLALPNPNSGIDAVGLRDGRIVLIYNHTATARTPLNLAVSTDGEHFTPFKTLEDQPGEYSYPAIIQSAGGDLYATWTWNRKRIRFAAIPLASVPKPSNSN